MPSLTQVREAINAVRNVRALGDTLTNPAFEGWNEADLVGVIEGLGKYISQSRKSSIKASVVNWDESGMMWPLTQDEIASLRENGKLDTVLPEGLATDDHIVFVPVGWTRGELGRDVGLSMATAAVVPISDQDVVRFIERHYRKGGIDLTADHVYLLIWLKDEGLLPRLSELSSAESALASVLVKAWDLLEVFARDAHESVQVLVNALDGDSLDFEQLLFHSTRCEWTAPGEIGRVRMAIEAAVHAPESNAVISIARSRLQSLRHAASRGTLSRKLEVPRDFNVGHAQRVCELAGLLSHEVEEKSIRADIREKLTAMGLANDLDREIGEGVRAWKSGLLEEFYSSRLLRAEGDLEWSSSWEQTLQAAGISK